jgi:predicted  nucleic acid-binding Zn-ribbon protein
MIEISKKNIETLVKLQEAETEIVRLKAVLETIGKEKITLNKTLKQFGDALEKNKTKYSSASLACRDSEREIQVVDERIIRSNEKLRMVKTNKEYQLLLREVDDNKKRKDVLETELLEFFDEKDKIEKVVEESETEFDSLNDKITAQKKQIDEKSADDRELLDEYLASQNKIGKTLDPSLMERFTKVSKMNDGSAVAGVKDEICLGCFMNVPPQLYIEAQRGTSLISCPQCSRILHYVAV